MLAPSKKSASKSKSKVWRPYRTYKFVGQDPMVGRIFTALASGDFKIAEACRRSGVSPSTLHNWKNKTTRQPQFATMNATALAVGYELVLQKRNGNGVKHV